MASSTTRTARSCEWTFTDHLGTPLLQTNSSKAVVWRAEYAPYGDIYAMRNGTKDDQPLRFPGQERLFDGSTGTEERYNVFRWYRSSWGKYTQADPIGLRGGTNLYGYVLGSPVMAADPLGLVTWKCSLSIVSGVLPRIGVIGRLIPKPGVGGARIKLFCESMGCVGGKKVSADISIWPFGLSVGSPSMSVGNITLEDDRSIPSADVFEGSASLRQIGAAWGDGWSHTELRVGGAFGTTAPRDAGLDGGFTYGDDSAAWGAGFDLMAGRASVDSSNVSCCKR